MKDLTAGSIHKTFFLISIPIILSSLLNSAFGMIDTSIAGLFLGAKGLAALGATTSFFFLGNSIFYGLTYGVSTSVAKMFGAHQYERLRSVFYSNLLLIVGATVLIALGFIPLWRPIFSFLNVDPLITDDARDYFFCLCLIMLPNMVQHYCTFCSNSLGETKFPLYVSIFGSLLNIGGNLLSVAVLDLGVLGLGLASLFSSCVSSLLLLWHFCRYFKKIGASKHPYRFRWKHITSLLSYSLPNMFQQSAMYVAALFLAPITNGLGYTAVAALSIINRIENLHSQIYYASARTAGNYVAQCVGAKKYEKIRPALGVAFLQAFLFFLPILIAVWCFPQVVCRLFIDEAAEPAVTSYVTLYIRRFLPFIVLNVVCGVFHSVFRGIKSNRHMIISTCLSAFSKVLIAYPLAARYGLIGYIISGLAAWALECCYIGVIFFTGLWVPKSIRKNVLTSKKRDTSESTAEHKPPVSV